jgi:hypothetical protein
MKTAEIIWKLIGVILKPLADALGEDPEEARKELVKRVTISDTSAEDKEKEIRDELPDA